MDEKKIKMLNSIKGFNNKTFDEVLENKKIVIFGTGSGSENFVKEYNVFPSYFVDNNTNKWGKNFYGREIYNPSIIKEENFTQIFIFVPSIYYSEISMQLNELGLKENIDYTDALNIENTLYFKMHENKKEMPKLTEIDLKDIENELKMSLVEVEDLYIDINDLNKFKSKYIFDEKYLKNYGNASTEKLLEHYVACKLLNLEQYTEDDYYIDVAACSSPWAKILRSENINAYAIDLDVSEAYHDFPYYMMLDATRTTFNDNSIMGMSLQCAYEMFLKDDDINFVKESSRILRKGGKIIISPLYMHKLYCSTCSPEYIEQGYSDEDSVEFIRRDYFGIPSSRKYDVEHLKNRVLCTAEKHGLKCKVYVLRNKNYISKDVYLHFILELQKL